MRALSCGERAILAQDGPEDDPDPFRVLEDRQLTARRVHECSGCDGGWINPGETYRRIVGLDDSRFEIRRYCMLPYCNRSARTWRVE